MISSQAIKLFDYLGKNEQLGFQSWLNCSLHTQNKKVRALGNLILDNISSGQLQTQTRQSLHQAIYLTSEYNEFQINNLLSDLQETLQNFLGFLEYQNKPAKQLMNNSLALNKRNALDYSEKIIKKIERRETKNEHRSFENAFTKTEILQQKDFFQLSKKPHEFSQYLQDQMIALDDFYLIAKLKLACEMQNRAQVVKQPYEITWIEELAPIIQNAELNSKCIYIYHLCFKMLKNREENDFDLLAEQLKIAAKFFPENELKVLYNYLLNYCIQAINSGQSKFYQKTFSIFKTLLENELIFTNGYLSEWSFKNIITTGIRLKEFDWTKAFIDSYKETLPQKDRSNAVAYNLASLYFAEDKHTEALSALIGVEFTDPTYFIGAKIIQLKSYYELLESEPFFSLIESFNKYISRKKKLTPHRIKANANFLRLAKRLYKLKSTRKLTTEKNWSTKIRSFRARFHELKPIANIDWIENKYEELLQ